MTKDFRIVAARPGGPEVLVAEMLPDQKPGRGQVLVRQRAIGVNFVDVYHRSGLYPRTYPAAIGAEAAGVVEAVGEDVHSFAPGDRVAYGTGGQGSYATRRLMPAEHLILLPDGIPDEVAAAIMLKGMTTAYLVGPCGGIRAGHIVLVQAAAGGVGSLLVPWLKALGARVIAHTGSERKLDYVRALGADVAVCCEFTELPAAVNAFSEGAGADVVFDGVGAASWDASIAATAACGLLVSFGNASGVAPAIAPLDLMRAGSIFLTRPTLHDYGSTLERRTALADALFTRLLAGDLRVEIGQRFPLSAAAEAHRHLENRETVGATILDVTD